MKYSVASIIGAFFLLTAALLVSGCDQPNKSGKGTQSGGAQNTTSSGTQNSPSSSIPTAEELKGVWKHTGTQGGQPFIVYMYYDGNTGYLVSGSDDNHLIRDFKMIYADGKFKDTGSSGFEVSVTKKTDSTVIVKDDRGQSLDFTKISNPSGDLIDKIKNAPTRHDVEAQHQYNEMLDAFVAQAASAQIPVQKITEKLEQINQQLEGLGYKIADKDPGTPIAQNTQLDALKGRFVLQKR